MEQNQGITFVVLSDIQETAKELRSVLGGDERARLLSTVHSIEQAASEIRRLQPAAVIISLNDQQAGFKAIQRMSAECADAMIICASEDSSPDLILESLRAGAREFLRLPIKTDEFKTVLNRTAEFAAKHTRENRKLGRIISVFSSKGGCGSSFVAANLAAALSGTRALVDLNLQSGDLDLFFGLNHKFSIADLVENRARLDDSLITGYMTPYSSNLAILPAPREAASAEDIKPEHVFEVIHLLRERYDYVVIDPHHTLDVITLEALDHADDLLVVLTLDVSSIRGAQRSLKLFDQLGYPRKKIRVIVNRWSKQVDLELQDVERFLSQRVAGFIPNDYRAAVNSINLGHPLVHSQPSSNITAEIKRLAALLAGESGGEKERRRKLFGSIFNRQASAAPLGLQATPDKA